MHCVVLIPVLPAAAAPRSAAKCGAARSHSSPGSAAASAARLASSHHLLPRRAVPAEVITFTVQAESSAMSSIAPGAHARRRMCFECQRRVHRGRERRGAPGHRSADESRRLASLSPGQYGAAHSGFFEKGAARCAGPLAAITACRERAPPVFAWTTIALEAYNRVVVRTRRPRTRPSKQARAQDLRRSPAPTARAPLVLFAARWQSGRPSEGENKS